MTETEKHTDPPATDDRLQGTDVVSDPAKDDTDGQDWSDEGGATPSGPAAIDNDPSD